MRSFLGGMGILAQSTLSSSEFCKSPALQAGKAILLPTRVYEPERRLGGRGRPRKGPARVSTGPRRQRGAARRPVLASDSAGFSARPRSL